MEKKTVVKGSIWDSERERPLGLLYCRKSCFHHVSEDSVTYHPSIIWISMAWGISLPPQCWGVPVTLWMGRDYALGSWKQSGEWETESKSKNWGPQAAAGQCLWFTLTFWIPRFWYQMWSQVVSSCRGWKRGWVSPPETEAGSRQWKHQVLAIRSVVSDKGLASWLSVQSLSHVWLFANPWMAACQASLSLTNSRSLLSHIHQVGDAILTSHPLSLSPPTFNLA